MDQEQDKQIEFEMIKSLNETKIKILECISSDSVDGKSKSKLVKHLIRIDKALIRKLLDQDPDQDQEPDPDIYHHIIKNEELK
jgi:hypothetical protein